MHSDQVPHAKAELRTRARQQRRSLSEEERDRQSRIVAEKLLALPEIRRAKLVLAYASREHELDTSGIIATLLGRGVRVALPRVSGPGKLTLHECRSTDLEAGYCGIPEPRETDPLVQHEDVSVVLVPGVAFDGSCRRLGYGRGFYDRLLPLLPRAFWVGLAFDQQILGSIPAEDHDMLLDLVLTPSEQCACVRGPGGL